MKLTIGKTAESICRNSAEIVSDKSMKSDDENKSVMIPCKLAILYKLLKDSSFVNISIILQGSIDGAIFDRSTSAIFKPTISPTRNSFRFFKPR
jgi:hypothetical protein